MKRFTLYAVDVDDGELVVVGSAEQEGGFRIKMNTSHWSGLRCLAVLSSRVLRQFEDAGIQQAPPDPEDFVVYASRRGSVPDRNPKVFQGYVYDKDTVLLILNVSEDEFARLESNMFGFAKVRASKRWRKKRRKPRRIY